FPCTRRCFRAEITGAPTSPSPRPPRAFPGREGVAVVRGGGVRHPDGGPTCRFRRVLPGPVRYRAGVGPGNWVAGPGGVILRPRVRREERAPGPRWRVTSGADRPSCPPSETDTPASRSRTRRYCDLRHGLATGWNEGTIRQRSPTVVGGNGAAVDFGPECAGAGERPNWAMTDARGCAAGWKALVGLRVHGLRAVAAGVPVRPYFRRC